MNHALLIFVRHPERGKVKTRLARTLGDAEALRIYRLLLEKTREATLGVNAGRFLFYTDRIVETDEWPAAAFHKYVQADGDLGARMHAAFETAFAAGAAKAVIIGSDCPELDAGIIDRAFAALDAADFALGPTPDGGYYLLGMKKLEPALFTGIAWSTETVREKTLEKIRRLGCTATLLPELSDIDTEADWRAYLTRHAD